MERRLKGAGRLHRSVRVGSGVDGNISLLLLSSGTIPIGELGSGETGTIIEF